MEEFQILERGQYLAKKVDPNICVGELSAATQPFTC